MTLKETPYWWASHEGSSDAQEPLPPQANVVVVGAGYTGLAAAIRLARSGASVVVLEKETIGFGASSRNGGQVLTGLKVPPRSLLQRFGREHARRLFSASLSAIAFLEELLTREGIECHYCRSGHLEAAAKPSHFERFQRDRDLLASEFGHEVRLIPRKDQRHELGSDYYHGLLLDEGSRCLHPQEYVQGLAEAARRAGASLHELTPALEIRREGARFTVLSPRGNVICEDILIATNGYTDLPPFRSGLIPVGSYTIATAPLSDQQTEAVLPRRRVVFDSKNFLFYFRLSQDNRLLFGGRAQWTPSTPQSTRRSAAILRAGLSQVFPELAKVEVEWAWSGNVCFTRDLLPRAGKLDRLHFALGYGGHGVAMATYLGDIMGEVLLGGQDRNPFKDLPWNRIPLYDGRPWFLPFVGVYYKILDWIL